jgi:hypothetical protein
MGCPFRFGGLINNRPSDPIHAGPANAQSLSDLARAEPGVSHLGVLLAFTLPTQRAAWSVVRV